jgi:hypothetical protein
MKVKVKHVDEVAVFAIYDDDDVQNLAMETCPILLALVSFCQNNYQILCILNVLIDL